MHGGDVLARVKLDESVYGNCKNDMEEQEAEVQLLVCLGDMFSCGVAGISNKGIPPFLSLYDC